jgi:hypothetical protein
MNDKINYSGYVEMFLDSGDDFEPYGCVPSLQYATVSTSREDRLEQHKAFLFANPLED